MKKLTLFLATILCACLAIAQVPQTMNFQALIRNAENEVVTNQQVDVEVRVLNASQTAVYVETHSVTTSSGGVATMEIGAGTPVSGSFAAIDWAAGRYYLETRIQLPDGSDALTDVSPLLSVPYSLYAAKAGDVDIDLSEYAKKSDIPEAVDLSDYALKSEIPSEVSLEEYAKKSEIPAMPDLSGYALKSEIPAEVDLTDYAKKSDIPEAVDLSDYALKSEIPAAVDLTDYALKSELPTVPDVTGFATKTEVSENYLTKETFENYVLGAGQPESVDLSVYAKSADVNAALATLESQIPDEVDLTDYAKSADIESAYAKKTDLSGYALVSQIPDEVDLTDYAKSADIESAYAKKTDLDGYALVSQIPDEVDLTDYALKSELPTVPDVTGYATKTEVSENYLTKETFENYVLGAGQPESVDLSVYAKTADVNAALATLESQLPEEVDLTDYAKSADIESAYAKKTDLDGYALVSQIPDEVDLTDYAKSTDIESAYAKKTDLSGYALVSQIPDEVDLTDYAKSADIESTYAKKTDLNGYALVSQIPDEVDLTDYAKSADIESAYAKKTALNEYTKSGANISVFVNDVEYVKKSYVDSLFNVLKTQIAALPNGGGNGGENGNGNENGGENGNGNENGGENGGEVVQHENGRIDAKFSISAEKQVYFSQGNLQYQASTKTWRFAEHQWDIIGDDNANISETNTGWIDLFGWATSGYGVENPMYPYKSSEGDSDYRNSEDPYALLGSIDSTEYDWGYNNKISNGGNVENLWHTMNQDEWNYILTSRQNAAKLYGAAKVNGVNGIVILPDEWILPDGVLFNKGFNETSLYELNTYTTTDWAKMEANGAVFLPAVGYRKGTTVNDAGIDGYYWTGTRIGIGQTVKFTNTSIRTDYMWNDCIGYGVRVVQTAE